MHLHKRNMQNEVKWESYYTSQVAVMFNVSAAGTKSVWYQLYDRSEASIQHVRPFK